VSVRPILLFDPYHGGHHAEYVAHLLRAWARSDRPGRLVAAVPAQLPEEQPALFADALRDPRIEVAPLQGALPTPGSSLWEASQANARLLRKALKTHGPSRVVAAYLDHLQLALVLGRPSLGEARLSGILFRPSLHYGEGGSLGERARQRRKRALLRAMARNERLDHVFTLDHSAVPALQAMGLHAVPLPDPVAPSSPGGPLPEEVRRRFGFDRDRVVMVLFGALDERKGVIPLLDALARLAPSDLGRLGLLLAGPLVPRLRADVAERAAALRAQGAQVALHDAFVPVAEIQPLLRVADLVLGTYDRHVGSSAVLIRAAAAGRPVLSQDYGYMGDRVRRHRLGRTVDTENPTALTQALQAALEDPAAGFDSETAAAFAAANTPEAYARTILDHVAP
jgi:glycosyltransferase involved in cell wall biosynthesis